MTAQAAQKATQLPSAIELPVRPVGWRILIEPVEIKRETASGIALPDEAVRAQEYLRYFGVVKAMGELCYKHNKFKPHPDAKPPVWCKVGDYVAFGRHAGQEVIVNEDGTVKKLKLVNDDEILAVVDDPTALVTPM